MIELAIAGIGLAAMLIGKALAAGDRQKADELRRQALAQFGDAAAPKLDDLVKSHLYNEDPALKGAQAGALHQLTAPGDGQLDAEGRAMTDQAAIEAARTQRGYSGALDQSMQARGMGGSGLEYLGQQMGIQGASDSMYHAGVQAAGDREREKIQRMMSGAQLAGQMRDQGQEANRAQDAIDKFNSGLQQKRWEDDMAVRSAKYTANRQAANDELGYAQNTESTATGLGNVAMGAAGDIATANNADPKKRGYP